MKTIYSLERPHSVQKSLIEIPPKGYKFIKSWEELSLPPSISFYQKIKNKLSYNPLLKNLWDFSKKFRNPILRKYNSMEGFDKTPEIAKADIIFSGKILPTKKPYWIDLEHVRQLMGWDINLFFKNREWISEHLEQEECKLITSWTKAGITTVIQNLPNSRTFRKKCYFIHNALPSVNFERRFEDKDIIAFLFMSSFNLPYDFNFKGGNIVLEAFSRMYSENKNLKLIVKSWVPKKLLKKYKGIKGISFQGISPFSEMDKIFKQTDVFLSPNHNTPAQAYLDAMNYSMPIITTDLWANSEIVKNNYNGLLIPPAKNVPYFIGKNIPNSRSSEFNRAIEVLDQDLVNNIIRTSWKIIENPKLREKLGKNGKKEIESGEFSIKKRNEKLKRLLDKHFQ